MLDSFLRSLIKDSYGPIQFQQANGTHLPVPVVLHKFHDTFSVLHWGKMPDLLADRGRANAFTFHYLNQELKSETAWKSFLRSADALTFRKAAATIPQSGNVSSMLNELTETFPVHSNYLGLVDETTFKGLSAKVSLTTKHLLQETPNLFTSGAHVYPVCELYQDEKVPVSSVMGRSVWDYSIWKKQTTPRMLPFEFQFHFTLTENSLAKLDHSCLALPKTASLATLHAGMSWDFPLVELILAQDPNQKRIGFSEAIWMTGWSPEYLQRTILNATWIAAHTRSIFHRVKLPLQGLSLRFAVNEAAVGGAKCILTDSLHLDDLQLEGLHMDESLHYYQKTSWYESVLHAQKQANLQGLTEWKRLCVEPAPWLDQKVKQNLERMGPQVASALHSEFAGAGKK